MRNEWKAVLRRPQVKAPGNAYGAPPEDDARQGIREDHVVRRPAARENLPFIGDAGLTDQPGTQATARTSRDPTACLVARRKVSPHGRLLCTRPGRPRC